MLLLIGASGVALGQGISRGTITGSISDPTGAVVPGVRVSITNAATGDVRVVESNESGVYVVSAIPAGTYDITAELAGFERQVLRGISLEAEQRLGVDLELQVGEVTTTVEVSGAAPVLDTESGEVSSLIDSMQVAEMPINGRNWSQFGRLAAGVAAEATDQRGIGQEGNPLLAVHGTRTDKVRYAIDGIQNMDTGGQRGINNFPPPEAIAEVKFLTSNFNAESGSYGGGVGNIVIKGGGQQFHGDFYNFVRNNVMDSANFFATEAAPAQAKPLRIHSRGTDLVRGLQRRKDQDLLLHIHFAVQAARPVDAGSDIPCPDSDGGDAAGRLHGPAAGQGP